MPGVYTWQVACTAALSGTKHYPITFRAIIHSHAVHTRLCVPHCCPSSLPLCRLQKDLQKVMGFEVLEEDEEEERSHGWVHSHLAERMATQRNRPWTVGDTLPDE